MKMDQVMNDADVRPEGESNPGPLSLKASELTTHYVSVTLQTSG